VLRQRDSLVGRIEYVDRFGNLISNLTLRDLREFESSLGRLPARVHIGGQALQGLLTSYSQAPPDRPAALVNSNGRVEVFVNGKSAARHLGVGVGAEIVASL
jgi:S-adenosylmethionine hydrolase